jgi:hypothetical protein
MVLAAVDVSNRQCATRRQRAVFGHGAVETPPITGASLARHRHHHVLAGGAAVAVVNRDRIGHRQV